MKIFGKVLNTFVGGVIGLGLGFVLLRLFVAVFGDTWSTAEGGPWFVIYSPFLISVAVGGVVGFFKGIKKAVISCLITLLFFFVGGLLLMLVAGMFVGGGAIYVVAVVGLVAGGITAMNAIVK